MNCPSCKSSDTRLDKNKAGMVTDLIPLICNNCGISFYNHLLKDLDIPDSDLNLKIETHVITAKPRQLNVKWTCESELLLSSGFNKITIFSRIKNMFINLFKPKPNAEIELIKALGDDWLRGLDQAVINEVNKTRND